MSLDALKVILDDLPDPSFVEGKAALVEQLSIALPDGDVGAIDDKKFVDWLVEHSEDAPFGDKGETKLDKKVRAAKRLKARGKAVIGGFEPKTVLPAIEAQLSPLFHLDAHLEDVIVYEKGGKFARHKDTPRTTNLVGTLVVGLPIAHQGGEFTIVDAGKKHVVDWSGKPAAGQVTWVALFSDLDHAVEPVTSGARVTLVYSLSRSDRPRTDAARDQKLDKLRKALGALEIEKKNPMMIACTRHIITDGTQPQSLETLRGTDREIADAFVEAGFGVSVRACLVTDDEGEDEDSERTFPENPWSITRLSKAIPPKVIAGMDEIVSFTTEVSADEYETDGEGATLLGEYILDYVRIERWVIRKRAAATAIYEGMYSETGYFGNEASMGNIYTLAALEISGPKKAPKTKAKPKTTTKAKPKTTTKAKPKAKAKAKKR